MMRAYHADPLAMDRPTPRPPAGHAYRLLLVVALAAIAVTAPAIASASEPAPATAGACCTAPAGTLVELQILDTVTSRTAKPGDRVRIRLAAPVTVDGQQVLPAGIDGEAEVIHAERSRGGGKPGELLLAARFLRAPSGDVVALKAMKLGGSGKDNGAGALGVALVAGPFGMLVRGGELEIPPGAAAQAKLAAAVTVPGTPGSAAMPAAPEQLPTHDAGTDPRDRGAEASPPTGTSP